MAVPKLLFFLFIFAFVSHCKCYDDILNPYYDITEVRVGLSTVGDTSKVVNVKDYGAKGDGSDATKAFTQAWSAACSSNSEVTLLIPGSNTFLLKPISFNGPCNSPIVVNIKGTIKASSRRSDWSEDRRRWILFKQVDNLKVMGGGTVNGNGEVWWKTSCKVDKSQPCTKAPTAMTFYSCDNLNVDGLSIENSQQIHISIEQCNNVKASSLKISAPEDSPNTDGIHVSNTKNIQISNCNIKTGDDCISIENGCSGLTANNINCGPGHGISIGSLGSGHERAQVSNVMINTATLSGTTNGLRIKTYQGGSGYARNITFQNINMKNVRNPIIIDQFYCDSSKPCPAQSSAVEVSKVIYKNIKGTSARSLAINFNCSKSVPCHDIVLQDINLAPHSGGSSTSNCNNVKNLSKKGTVKPSVCGQRLLQVIMESLLLSY